MKKKNKKIAKGLLIGGSIVCFFSFEGVLIFLWNLITNVIGALALQLYATEQIGIMLIQLVGVVIAAIGINLAYWRLKGFKTSNLCPREQIVYWEWAFATVLLPHWSLPLGIVGFPQELISFLFWVSHHLFFGAIIFTLWNLAFHAVATSRPHWERKLEQWEILPEIDTIRTIVLSTLLGFYFHIGVEAIYGMEIVL